jgi:anaerobic magnesium-protoporphyrin IX monomethyl ester cyclase
MHIALVGADLEENLGVGMIAAVGEHAGHSVTVVPFNDAQQRGEALSRVLSLRAQVVGLSIQFQHRSSEFLALAVDLRSRGYAGHITTGGQYPSLAYREVLAGGYGVDSVVLHDGEESFIELLDALEAGAPLAGIAGLAILGDEGAPIRTRGRRLADDLDRFPFPKRYREHTRHVGVPFIPIMGGRGCWGRCSYCSITSFYRDAREHGGGRMLRYRSPENVAEEMALLLHRAGPRAVFCFHDDSLLLPRPEASLARLSAIREALDRRCESKIGLIGKCRPDSLTPALALRLRELGVVRLYLGVENTSGPGLAHLRRGVRAEQIRAALDACREAGIFVCYNLLLFEPEATLDDIADNISFVREHAEHPVNFGRAEPYYGTPLQRQLAAEGNLSGDHLGHGYRVKDDRTELLFRICAAIFRQRNYDPDGVHNRTMGVGYTATLLEHFFAGDRMSRRAVISAEAASLTRQITLESAELLEEALSLARGADLADRDRIERETALLGLRVAAADGRRHEQLDQFYRDVDRSVAQSSAPRIGRAAVTAAKRAAQLFQGVALASLLAAGVEGCDGRMVVDPDAGPLDSRLDHRPRDGGAEYMVVDPDASPLDRAQPRDVGEQLIVDPDVGPLDQPHPGDAKSGEQLIVDPPPPPDGAVGDRRLIEAPDIDRWRDTAPRHVTRTTDLPLFDPPSVQLAAASDDEQSVEVQLVGVGETVSARWEGDGEIVGKGAVVRWLPASETDQIRVGVRSSGGVAVAALRAKDVRRRV